MLSVTEILASLLHFGLTGVHTALTSFDFASIGSVLADSALANLFIDIVTSGDEEMINTLIAFIASPFILISIYVSRRNARKRIRQMESAQICMACDSPNITTNGDHVVCHGCFADYHISNFTSRVSTKEINAASDTAGAQLEDIARIADGR